MKISNLTIRRPLFAFAAAALLATSSAGLAQHAGKKHSDAPGMTGSAEMHAVMKDMAKNMDTMKMTGDTDKDFAMMMKMHHQAAIDMSNIELKKGKDEKLHKMSKKMIDAQKKEIKELDEWLAKHK